MSAQPLPINQKSNTEHANLKQQCLRIGEFQYPQSLKWVAVFIDAKFYLTNPSAFQKLQTLDKEICEEKFKLAQLNKQQNIQPESSKKVIQADIKKEVRQRKNSFESSLSRECKTQINELKALKAKIEIEKQLAQQQMKFQHKTIEVKKRRQLKQSTTFVIRNQREKSMEQTQRKSIKENSKNFMMAPHQLANKKSEQKQTKIKEKSRLKQSQSNAEEKQEKSIREKRQKTVRNEEINSKYTEYSKNRYNKESEVSKSKQKSFIITSRKVNSSCQSKDAVNCLISGPKQQKDRENSNNQIEKLNMKLKQMQQKLMKVEQKQKQLQEMDKEKLHQDSRVSKQKNSKNSRVSSRTITVIEKHSINEEKESSNSHVVQIQGIKRKDKKIQKILEVDGNDKQSLISEKKITKRQQLRKIAQERHRPRKLEIASSTIAYNFTQDLLKQKSIEEENNKKQRMDLEITELKKVIKQLKIDKIKQEAMIHQLQSKTNKRQTNNFIEQNESNITFQGTESKSSSIVHENNFNQTQLQQQIQTPIEQIKTIQNDRPLAKREARRSLKFDPNTQKNLKFNLQISGQQKKTTQVSSASKVKQNQRTINPQDSQVSSTKGELKKKGIIIRQLINKQKFNSLEFTNSDHFGDDFQLEQQSKFGSQQKSYAEKKNSKVSAIFDFDINQFQKPQISVPEIEVLQAFPIPELPSTPLADATQGQILAAAKKICQIFEIKVNSREQLQFKKFKNCVILKTNEINKAIVWHFSGKFYVGGWDQNSGSGEDHKHGDGFQFVPNKHYYRGEFANGKRNGQGTMIMLDGDIYKGQWQNGERHGQGKYFEKKTNSIYEGEWKQGKKDGFGTHKFKDNQFYQGSFSRNSKEGNGLQLFANGDLYVGEYKSGKFEGRGKYFWSNGSVYVGEFIDGERQGQGKWISNIIEGDIYIGCYKKDKKEGKGRYVWAKGCAFDGQFKSDFKHGQGKVEYQDGRQVKGIWQFGKLKKIHRPEDQEQENYQNYSFEQIQPRIRPNIPRIMQTPSRQMQESKLINGL